VTTLEEAQAVWVIADLMPDGTTYVPTIHIGDDLAFPLDGDRAIAYALAVQTAAERAAYDEIVCAQLMELLKGDGSLVAEVVSTLRERRPPLDDAATAPLTFEPFVSARTREGGLFVSVHGKRLFQWSVADARQHAGHVIQVLCGVELDAAYRTLLTEHVGVDAGTARAMVDNLQTHRKESE
jgi:hypothetical protein